MAVAETTMTPAPSATADIDRRLNTLVSLVEQRTADLTTMMAAVNKAAAAADKAAAAAANLGDHGSLPTTYIPAPVPVLVETSSTPTLQPFVVPKPKPSTPTKCSMECLDDENCQVMPTLLRDLSFPAILLPPMRKGNEEQKWLPPTHMKVAEDNGERPMPWPSFQELQADDHGDRCAIITGQKDKGLLHANPQDAFFFEGPRPEPEIDVSAAPVANHLNIGSSESRTVHSEAQNNGGEFARSIGGESAYTPKGLVRAELIVECIAVNHFPEKHKEGAEERPMPWQSFVCYCQGMISMQPQQTPQGGQSVWATLPPRSNASIEHQKPIIMVFVPLLPRHCYCTMTRISRKATKFAGKCYSVQFEVLATKKGNLVLPIDLFVQWDPGIRKILLMLEIILGKLQSILGPEFQKNTSKDHWLDEILPCQYLGQNGICQHGAMVHLQRRICIVVASYNPYGASQEDGVSRYCLVLPKHFSTSPSAILCHATSAMLVIQHGDMDKYIPVEGNMSIIFLQLLQLTQESDNRRLCDLHTMFSIDGGTSATMPLKQDANVFMRHWGMMFLESHLQEVTNYMTLEFNCGLVVPTKSEAMYQQLIWDPGGPVFQFARSDRSRIFVRSWVHLKTHSHGVEMLSILIILERWPEQIKV